MSPYIPFYETQPQLKKRLDAATNRIESLESANAELRAEVERLQEAADRTWDEYYHQKVAREDAETEIVRLHAIIEAAPHDEFCGYETELDENGEWPCNCWKSVALKEQPNV